MEKEKVCSLEKMPMKNKIAYCKLLSLMVKIDENINQLKLMELYRLMANIRIPSSQRQEIIGFLFKGQEGIEELCNTMMEGVNQQEKNILRFSLIKDLMIIKGVNSNSSFEENTILKKIEELLNISKEQKKFFEEEYYSDLTFYKRKKKEKLYDCLQKETLAKALALGIPLSVVLLSGYSWGIGGPMGVLSGLESIGFKKRTKRYSAAVGLGVSIIAAFSTYHLVKWIWSYMRNNQYKLKDLIKQEMLLIHQRAIKYLEKDVEFYQELQQGEVQLLLVDTLGYMKKTRPRVI